MSLNALIQTGDISWQDRALCRSVDPEQFFPERGVPVPKVKRVCAACPVRQQCLDYAIGNGEKHGIWGGMSTEERHALAKQQGRPVRRDVAPHGTEAAARRHYRHGEPLCESCKQGTTRRVAERWAADLASGKAVRAVHAASGGGTWCNVRCAVGELLTAGPDEEVTCLRCLGYMGRRSA